MYKLIHIIHVQFFYLSKMKLCTKKKFDRLDLNIFNVLTDKILLAFDTRYAILKVLHLQ